jgi:plastocyanin
MLRLSKFHLILSVAAVAAVAGCSNSSTTPTPAANVTIVQGASLLTTTAYSPNPFTVSLASGGTVIWRNDDQGVSHTVTSDPGDPAAFASATLAPGVSFSFVFAVPGTYNYHCSIHPGMVATINVTP